MDGGVDRPQAGSDALAVLVAHEAHGRADEVHHARLHRSQRPGGVDRLRQAVEGAPLWRGPERVRERYARACERLHLPSDYYQLDFEQQQRALRMRFKKDAQHVKRRLSMLGKSIIITDNHDWSTPEIVQAHLDRWQVEDAFRSSKAPDLIGVQAIRHWTDSRIRCHRSPASSPSPTCGASSYTSTRPAPR